MKKEKRFEVILKEGNSLKSEGYRMVLVDKETGVTYLTLHSGYGLGLTPLLDKDGKPIITEID